MSIQPLPGDVVAQIKSSTTITSLNGAVCGLLQNSLDAGASKVSISVDYSRGNCSIEDDGHGIAPASFQEDGGLGRLHYTSRYPPQQDCHGRRGEFLASLGALSLLSIASHHRNYRTHNSLAIHNCRVVSRNLPAPPEERLLASASGTRVVVRDLFGSMPVRVKQRAIEVERAGTSRDFDQLVFNIVALLLPWSGDVTVWIQDSYAHRTVSLRASGVVDWGLSYRSTAPEMVSRTTTLLAQASLVDSGHLKSWVPIGATASGVSVRGCVSLQPVATKRVQFIALGIRPLLNEHHTNLFYEDVNRVFEDSSFGVVEEASFDEDGRPVKTQAFRGKELKPKRGIDRWPMFFLQVMLDVGTDLVDIDEFFDEGHQTIAAVTDLLQVMAYEFLKKHHFRPRSVSAVEKLTRPKSNSPAPSSQPSWVSSPRHLKGRAGATDKASRSRQPLGRKISSPHSRIQRSERRSASPFTSWSRTKSVVGSDSREKDNTFSDQSAQPTPDGSGMKRKLGPTMPQTVLGSKTPFFDKAGALLRKPFDDVDEASTTPRNDIPEQPPRNVQATTEIGNKRETILWVDPITKIKSLIDPRTGFAVKSRAAAEGKTSPSSMDIERADTAPRRPLGWKAPSACEKPILFQPTESRIPQVPQVSEILGCQHDGYSHGCVEERPNGNMLATLEGRISKTALQKAQILAQVDQKFIMVKAVTESPANLSRGFESDGLLILIDQHAADERCKVEGLLKAYFTPDPAGTSGVVAQTQPLDKSLRFDLSGQDGDLLVRFKPHFAHWGILYDTPHDQEISQKGVTVEVYSLPPSILERCRLEPRLLIDLLRKEIWKLHATGSAGARGLLRANLAGDWVSRFHNCPEGILDLINSRACRSAIMFNDPLTLDQCLDLVHRLAECAFPFQCAHGRPSMVPLVHLGQKSALGLADTEAGDQDGDLLGALKRWKRKRKDAN